jgi:hypothetical protein
MQGVLFPTLEEELGPLTPKHQQIVAVLNLVDIDAQVPAASKGVDRPPWPVDFVYLIWPLLR